MRPVPPLRLRGCVVRAWAPSDAEELARHANDRDVWRNLRDRFPHPYTLADADSWILTCLSADPVTHFCIEVDGEAGGGVGFEIGCDVHRRSAEIGYWLGRPFRGRGIATEALEAVTALAFAEHDLVRVHAYVYAWNPASVRVLEKAGYRFEGRLRQAVTKDGLTTDLLVFATTRP